jgi:glutaconate CoA-transferase subunit B
VAGAATLRRWVRRPVLVVPKQSRRNLVPRVQVASTEDPERTTPLVTDLGVFQLGRGGARLAARHEAAPLEQIRERTGFTFDCAPDVAVTAPPEPKFREALALLDPEGRRARLVR